MQEETQATAPSEAGRILYGKRGPGRPAGVQYPPAKKPKVVINGRKVAELRVAKRLAQWELGEKCFLTQAQISAIERGGVSCQIGAAYFLSKALRRPIEDLIEVLEDEG